MSLQWEEFEDWYLDMRYCIKRAVDRLEVQGEDGKKRKKGAALQALMRRQSDRQLNQGTLANKLTPTSESHDLSLREAWQILEITRDVDALMTLCRHRNMLLTHKVAPLPAAEEVLVPVFTKMRKELSETQDLIRKAVEERYSPKGAVSLPTKEELKREVYEDLCAAMAMATHLEAMMSSAPQEEEIADPGTRFSRLAADVANWSTGFVDRQPELDRFLAASGMRRKDFDRLSALDSADSGLSMKLYLKAIVADDSNDLLGAFCNSLGYRIYPLEPLSPRAPATSVLEQFSELEGRQADTLAKLNQALKDKTVTAAELEDITEELKEEYGAELALLNSFT